MPSHYFKFLGNKLQTNLACKQTKTNSGVWQTAKFQLIRKSQPSANYRQWSPNKANASSHHGQIRQMSSCSQTDFSTLLLCLEHKSLLLTLFGRALWTPTGWGCSLIHELFFAHIKFGKFNLSEVYFNRGKAWGVCQ